MNAILRSIGAAAVLACLLLAVNATEVKAQLLKPEDLRKPATLTCIYLPVQMSFRAERGMLKAVWEWRLERGPYVSEWEDDQGTFYRAPPGGAFAGRVDSFEKPSGPLTHRTSDGGFWMPRDPNAAPRLYSYYSTSDAPKAVPAENQNCSSVVAVKDPATSKLGASMATYGVVGAFIHLDVGKIQLKPIDDAAFIAKLREPAAQAAAVKEGSAEAKP